MDALERLLSRGKGLHLMWLGNDGWLLWDGGHLLGIDLDLFNPERLEPAPVGPEPLAKRLDGLLLSHEHEDHFNAATCRAIAEGGRCVFVVPQSCAEKAEETGLPRERVRLVRPGDKLRVAGAEIACIRAVHGHIGGTVYSGASMLDCGYHFTFGGKSLYQPGDTVLLEEQMELRADILFVSPTEHNTGAEGSGRLIEWVRPSAILPQHYGTYGEAPDNRFWTHGYVDELYAVLPAEEREKFRRPAMGEVVSLG